MDISECQPWQPSFQQQNIKQEPAWYHAEGERGEVTSELLRGGQR